MIILDATNESVQAVLAAPATTNELQFTSSFVDVTTSTYVPGGNDGVTTGTSDVTIVAAPSASTQRQVKQITVYNADTVAATVTMIKDVGGTNRILCKVTLQVADTLQYNDGEGFKVITTSGGIDNTLAQNFAISAGTQSVASGNVVFSNSNGVSFGMAGSSRITASISRANASFYECYHAELNTGTVFTQSTAANSSQGFSLQRMFFPYDFTATRMDLLASVTGAGSTAGSITYYGGVYTRNVSTLNSASTTTFGQTWNSGGATSNTNSYSGISGIRWRTMAPQSWAFTPGEYWFAFSISANGPANSSPAITLYGQSSIAIGGVAGGNNDVIGLAGIFSAATGNFPSAIGLSDIIYCSTGTIQSAVYRQPYFRMFGTY